MGGQNLGDHRAHHARIADALEHAIGNRGAQLPLADFDWTWPTVLHWPTVHRVFSLDFITKRENVVLVASPGLGKTMLTKKLLHRAVLAGHSALLITASDLLLEFNGQDTSRALECRLRAHARPQILAIDEIGYSVRRRARGRPAVFKSSVAATNNARASLPPICSSSSGTRCFRTRPVPSPSSTVWRV